jgi:hypothetical protein
MRYSGRNTGSDCFFPDRVPGFCESGVHANKKYRLNRLFRENNGFNGDLILQFSGLLTVTFFDTYLSWFFGRFGLQMPLVALYCDHVGEIGFLQGFWRGLGGFYFVGGCQDFSKIFSGNFSHAKKIIFRIFFLLIKFSRDFFAGSKFLFRLAMTGALRSQTIQSGERLE